MILLLYNYSANFPHEEKTLSLQWSRHSLTLDCVVSLLVNVTAIYFTSLKCKGLLIVSLEKSHSEFDPKFIVFNLCRNRLFRLFMLWYFRRVQIMVKELLNDRHGAISLWRDQTWMFLNYITFLSLPIRVCYNITQTYINK